MATVNFDVQFAENAYTVQFEETSMELDAQFEPNGGGGGGGGAVNSVNGKTGTVVLDAGDLEYDDEETYAAGSVGAELTSLKGDLSLKADYITDTARGAIASFSDGADNVPVKDLTVAIEPVQSGSGDPSPTNVRPISGHTQAKVTRYGINIWDEDWELGVWNGSGGKTPSNTAIRSKNYIPVTPSTTYYLKFPSRYTSGLIIRELDKNKGFLTTTTKETAGTFTVGSGCYFIVMCTYGSDNITTYNNDISINYPSTDTAYHAYNGQTVTISLDGTIYGGTLDVTTGVLTVTHTYYQFTGQETINGSATNAYINTSNFPTQMSVGTWYTDAKTKCDCLPKTNVGKGIRFGADNKTIYFYDLPDIVPAITDKASLDTWIASQKPCITYPIESFTVQLTAQEVSTLLGQNNVWADTGNTEVEYRADTKLYIEKLTVPTEDDMVADHAISSGSFFMIGNTLYRATTAIASGATITVGTNATRLSLSDALNALS